MNKIELAAKAKELKDKYFESDIEDIKDYMYRVEKEVLEVDRLLDRNNYTDEEIENLARKQEVPQKNIDLTESQYDIANMSFHNPVTEFGFNVEEASKDMRGIEYEILRFYVFDENYKMLGTCEGTNHDKFINPKTVKKIKNELYEKYPQAKNVISIHNHPHYVCANTNSGDDKATSELCVELKDKEINLYNDYVISELDIFSRNEYNANKKQEN